MSKKIPALTLAEVTDQLQMLEYIATNTAEGLSAGGRILLRKLQAQEKRLLERDRNPGDVATAIEQIEEVNLSWIS